MEAYVWYFYLIIGLSAIVACYPWSLRWPGAKWLLHLPWLIPLLWLRYEQVLPRHFNIRIDLLLIQGLFKIVVTIYVLRLLLFYWPRRKPQF